MTENLLRDSNSNWPIPGCWGVTTALGLSLWINQWLETDPDQTLLNGVTPVIDKGTGYTTLWATGEVFKK